MDDDIVQSTLKHRDKILEDSLQKGARLDHKTIQRNKDKQRKFLSERITFRIHNSSNQLVEGCEFSLMRSSLKASPSAIHTYIHKSALPYFEFDYFCDHEGNILYFEDLFLRARPSPAYYIMIAKVRRVPTDIKNDPRYVGK